MDFPQLFLGGIGGFAFERQPASPRRLYQSEQEFVDVNFLPSANHSRYCALCHPTIAPLVICVEALTAWHPLYVDSRQFRQFIHTVKERM